MKHTHVFFLLSTALLLTFSTSAQAADRGVHWLIPFSGAVLVSVVVAVLLVKRVSMLDSRPTRIIGFGVFFWLTLFLQLTLYAVYRTWLA